MIIGISGKMATGKTTLADQLVGLCGGKRVSFADELRVEVVKTFEIPLWYTQSREMKEKTMIPVGLRHLSVRELLQWWGAMRRETDQDYWVNKLMASVSNLPLVFVDDVRYYNEACAIRAVGGKVVRIDPYPEWQPGQGSQHASETDLDRGFTFDVVTSPAFGGLEAAAQSVRQRLFAG